MLPVLSVWVQTIHRDGCWVEGLYLIGLLLVCNGVLMRLMRWFCNGTQSVWCSVGWLFFWYGFPIVKGAQERVPGVARYFAGKRMVMFVFCFILFLCWICKVSTRWKITTKVFHAVSIGWLLLCGFWFVQSVSYLRSPIKKLPNIYHIMLRAYSNADHLQRGRTQYNNLPFYGALAKQGFVCFPHAVPYQGEVEENVRSILNFGLTNSKVLYAYSVPKKEVWKVLRKLGYCIHFFTNDVLDYSYPNEAESWLSFLRKNYCEYLCFFKKSSVARKETRKARWIFEKLQQGKESYQANNQYFYAYLSQPHRLCYASQARDFADNVQEVNQWLQSFVRAVLSQYPKDNQPIILLTGSHGRSIGEPNEEFIHSCLFCLYVPEAWRKEAKNVHVNHVYSFLVDQLRKM